MKKSFPVIALCTLVTLGVSPTALAAPQEFSSVNELMAADQPVAETVTTHNHGDPNDGISVTYTVSAEQSQGAEGGAAVKLANGQ